MVRQSRHDELIPVLSLPRDYALFRSLGPFWFLSLSGSAVVVDKSSRQLPIRIINVVCGITSVA